MILFENIAIVGTGLIGGSLALAIKKYKLCKRIIGVCRHKSSEIIAQKMGIFYRVSRSLKDINDAECVIVATPPSVCYEIAPLIAKIVKPEVIISDVSSTKENIVKEFEKYFNFYLGSHPLAGSEKRGIIYANAELFKGSICIVTPTKKTNLTAKKKIVQLWKMVGCNVVEMSAEKHDKILGRLSHLPHAIAFSLMNIITKEESKLAPPSFKEMTRIAGSDANLWSDIFLENKSALLSAMDSFEKKFLFFKKAIYEKNKFLLRKIIFSAKRKREGFLK
ncbi:MAG: prephenate dehydrogenase/arogenate dehydrogenase family protein [Candidatus Omnitrophica bacterium]|nr:prephenate dehydrogenase/arogenate dehydrogenase family protein [Candidatus Omnitrophota bacterium]